jgi:glycosyltransferase involved in cell wall biosynthesis
MATRAIWLHNEMAPEVHRTRHMSRTLPALFELYKEFDHLVAVSPRLRDLNAAELARYAPADRFVVVRNVIEPERVRALAAEELPTELDEDGCAEIPEWETRMQHSDGIHWFVNVGRLSPEKNQRRLIDAFAAVRAQRDDVGLLIVGSGPLRDDLQRHVDATGLGDRVFLTGAQDNPFAIMARSECFVLSSDYEGQPMVLLEAAALRLPIVTTAFASVVDAVPGSGIHITERSPESLADGMRAYLHGSVAPATIDAGYAEEVRRQFAALTDLPQLASGAAA